MRIANNPLNLLSCRFAEIKPSFQKIQRRKIYRARLRSELRTLVENFEKTNKVSDLNKIHNYINKILMPFLNFINRKKADEKIPLLKNFCLKANQIAYELSRICSDKTKHALILSFIEDHYLQILNDDFLKLNPRLDPEQAFAQSTGFTRAPVFMSYLTDHLDPTDITHIFSPVEHKFVPERVLDVLKNIFQGINIDSKTWSLGYFDDFGPLESFFDGFVYLSTIPFLSKNGLIQDQKDFGHFFSENELIAHETAHNILHFLGYNADCSQKTNSGFKNLTCSQVHELIAATAGMQFSVLPVLHNLFSVNTDDYLEDIKYAKELAIKIINEFLKKSNISIFEILNQPFPLKNFSSEGFMEFVRILQKKLNRCSNNGFREFEEFIKDRFMSEAKFFVKSLAERGFLQAQGV
jgi:hypothetical protein